MAKFIVSPEDADLIADFLDARRQESEAKKRIEFAKKRLDALLPTEGDIATDGDGIVLMTRGGRDRRDVDRALLQRLAPKTFVKVYKASRHALWVAPKS